MGKNKKNRGGKGKGAKKKKGVSLPPSHYINKQQNQDSLTTNPKVGFFLTVAICVKLSAIT